MLSISDIKDANRKAGYYFFSPDTLRFFASKILPCPYDGWQGCYFVTSEKKCFGDYRRVFHVRKFVKETGEVKSVYEGDTCNQLEFSTEQAARKYAHRLAHGC